MDLKLISRHPFEVPYKYNDTSIYLHNCPNRKEFLIIARIRSLEMMRLLHGHVIINGMEKELEQLFQDNFELLADYTRSFYNFYQKGRFEARLATLEVENAGLRLELTTQNKVISTLVAEIKILKGPSRAEKREWCGIFAGLNSSEDAVKVEESNKRAKADDCLPELGNGQSQ